MNIQAAVKDIVKLASRWVRRLDDARRLPEVLHEEAGAIIQKHLSPADDSESVDEVWLRSIGFLPEDEPTRFGLRIWDVDETECYGKHPAMQIVVSLIDLSFWLETYGTDGRSLCPHSDSGKNPRRHAAALPVARDG